MAASFIVRFDDICPEMNWAVWGKIESILDKYKIKPIVAIVPYNSDPFLKVDPPNLELWRKAKIWQKKGWAIGLHGFTHVYETSDPGIVGLNHRSEFSGLPLAIQQKKIDSAVEIFLENDLNIDIWVAPAHSFDGNTVIALKKRGINVVSDGYFRRVVNINGTVWVPQQLWRFKSIKSGVWTVCYHHNYWSEIDLVKFERDIISFEGQIITLQKALSQGGGTSISIRDRVHAFLWLKKLLFLKMLSSSFVGKLVSSELVRSIRGKNLYSN